MAYSSDPAYAETLDALLRKGAAVAPQAKMARVLLRPSDMGHIGHLRVAAPGLYLNFAEGTFSPRRARR